MYEWGGNLMLLRDIKIIAAEKGIDTKRLRTKRDVIHAIQKLEGNQECYGSNESCNNAVCCWHSDCIKPKPHNTKKL